jgi:osmotically-inducible protein OsmY
MKKTHALLLATTLSISLSGCYAATIFTAAEAGKTFAQERSTGARVDDNAIAMKINNAFVQKDFEQLFANIDTEISEGRVLIAGTVNNPDLRVEAERMVWEVPGVKEVINEIQVNNSSCLLYTSDAADDM